MKRPKLFLVTLAFIVAGGVSMCLALISWAATQANSVVAVIEAVVAIMAFTGAALVQTVRDEKQNQRENSRGNRLIKSMGTLSSDIVETPTGADELSKQVFALSNSIRGFDTALKRQEDIAAKLEAVSNNRSKFAVSETKPSAPARPAWSSLALESAEPKFTHSKTTNVSKEKASEEYTAQAHSGLPAFSYIPLTRTPLELTLEVENCFSVEIDLKVVSPLGISEPRLALMYARCTDADGKVIDYDYLPSKSDKHGWFSYISSRGPETDWHTRVDIPGNAKELQVGLIQWASAAEIRNQFTVRKVRTREDWPLLRRQSDIRVASILDEFSHNSFRYECDLIALELDKWKQQMDRFRPDVFLCESAWSGADSEKRPWQGRVYSSVNFKGENRSALLQILQYCKERGIPTVFWNKEDPSHYDDKVHNFVDTALKFDHIFTTDAGSVGRYKLEHGHQSVDVLPFAVQPRLFNPSTIGQRTQDVIFAGGWYSNHVARSADMAKIFDRVLDSGRGLKIYDRFDGTSDESHYFPEKYIAFTHPSVPNEEMANVYKESEIGITINTETKSSTMFARRIFELMACNTLVISNYSRGVEEFFGDGVIFLDEDPDGLTRLSNASVDDLRARNLALVLQEHTYAKRLKKILDVAGIVYDSSPVPVALAMMVDTVEAARMAAQNLRRIRDWRGPRTVILSQSVGNLEYADLLTELNADGVRLVYLPLLNNGETPLSEVCGAAQSTIVVTDLNRTEEDIREFAERVVIHSSYMDLPISAIEDVSMTDVPQYSVFSAHDVPMASVSSDELVRYLKAAHEHRNTYFYSI